MERDEDTTRLLEEFSRKRREMARVYHNLYTIVEYPSPFNEPAKPEEGEKGEELEENDHGVGGTQVGEVKSYPVPSETFWPIRGSLTSADTIPPVVNATVKAEIIDEAFGVFSGSTVEEGVPTEFHSNLREEEGIIEEGNMVQIPEDISRVNNEESENLIDLGGKVSEESPGQFVKDESRVFTEASQLIKQTETLLQELKMTQAQSEAFRPIEQHEGTAEPENAKTEPINEEITGDAGEEKPVEIEDSLVENIVGAITERGRTKEENLNEVRNAADNAVEAVAEVKNNVEIKSCCVENPIGLIGMEAAIGEASFGEIEASIPGKSIVPIGAKATNVEEVPNEAESSFVDNIVGEMKPEGNLAEIEDPIVVTVKEPIKNKEFTGHESLNEVKGSAVANVIDPIKEAKMNEVEDAIGEKVNGPITAEEVIGDGVPGEIEESIQKEKDMEAQNLDPIRLSIVESVMEPIREEDETGEENLDSTENSLLELSMEQMKTGKVTEDEKAVEPIQKGEVTRDEENLVKTEHPVLDKAIQPSREEGVTGGGHLVVLEDSFVAKYPNEPIEDVEGAIGVEKPLMGENGAQHAIGQSANRDTPCQISEEEVDVTLHLGSYFPEEPTHYFVTVEPDEVETLDISDCQEKSVEFVTESEDEVEAFGISDRSFVYDRDNDNLGPSATGNLVFETCGSFLDVGRIPLLDSAEEIPSSSNPVAVEYQESIPVSWKAEVMDEFREVTFQTVLDLKSVDGALSEMEPDVFPKVEPKVEVEPEIHPEVELKVLPKVELAPLPEADVLEEAGAFDTPEPRLESEHDAFPEAKPDAFLEPEPIALPEPYPNALPDEITDHELINWDDESYFEKIGLIDDRAEGDSPNNFECYALGDDDEDDVRDWEVSDFSFPAPEIPNIWESLVAYGIVPGFPDDADDAEVRDVDVGRPVTALQLCDSETQLIEGEIFVVKDANNNAGASEADEDAGLDDDDGAHSEEVVNRSMSERSGLDEMSTVIPATPSESSTSMDEDPIKPKEETKVAPLKKEIVENRRGALAEIRKLFTRVLINPLRRLFSKGA